PKRLRAESCLDRCWEELLSLNPVLRVATPQGMIFKCRFCARQHMFFDDAAACSRACRELFQRTHQLERQISGELADMPALPSRPKPDRKSLRQAIEVEMNADVPGSLPEQPPEPSPDLSPANEMEVIDPPIEMGDLSNIAEAPDDFLEPDADQEEAQLEQTEEPSEPVAQTLSDWADWDEEEPELEEIVDAI